MKIKFTEVPGIFEKEGIRYFVIDDDRKNSGGYYLLQHAEISENPVKDDWFLNLEDLYDTIETDYGIKQSMWKNYR